MVPEWLWQNLAGEFFAWLLLPSAGGIAMLLAYLRAKDSHWVAPILYGFIGFALVVVIWLSLVGISILSKQPQQTTIENVETNIKIWIDTFSLIVKKEFDQESYFGYSVFLSNRIPIFVKRTKKWDRYITFQVVLSLSPEHQSILRTFSKEHVSRISDELALEVARMDMEWQIDTLPQRIGLQKLVPITSSFTEAVFAERLHAMGNAAIVVRSRLVLALTSNRVVLP